MQQAKNDIIQEIERAKSEAPDLSHNDQYLENIEQFFEGKIGSPYSQTQLEALYREFDGRYKRRVPPGFKDTIKSKQTKEQGKEQDKEQDETPLSDNNMYGDVILWYQILDHAKEQQRPIVFITDDQKEDWWWKESGKTLGPRPELVEEIQEKAQVPFYMYTVDRFMERANDFLQIKVQSEAIEEARESRVQNMESSLGSLIGTAIFTFLLFAALQDDSNWKKLATGEDFLKYLREHQDNLPIMEEVTEEEQELLRKQVQQLLQSNQDDAMLKEEKE